MIEPAERSPWINHLWPPRSTHAERIQALQETGPLPFYTRYVGGAFREVWRELGALGEAIWFDPLAADALAVCYETMHRARANVETLVAALEAEGYEFLPAVYAPYWRKSQRMKEWVDAHDESSHLVAESMGEPLLNLREPARSQMNADRARRLPAAIETAQSFRDHKLGLARPFVPGPDIPRGWLRKITAPAGDMPMSLRAWYSAVGGVNLVGRHPELAPQGLECDPLFVAPLKCAVDVCDAWHEEHAGAPERPPFQLPISPPRNVKAGNGAGGEHYVITLPNAALDAVVENEPHRLPFVDYLRRAFEWGGFPGYADMPGEPPDFVYRMQRRMVAL